MSRNMLQEIAYEMYKQDWMDSHTTKEQRLQSMQEYYSLFLTEDYCYESYEEYLVDQGINGQIYVCYAEFCENEYQDEDFMKHLLGTELYKYFEEEGAFVKNKTFSVS